MRVCGVDITAYGKLGLLLKAVYTFWSDYLVWVAPIQKKQRWHLDYYTNLFEQEYTQWQNSVVEATRLVKPRYFDFGPS